MSLGVRSIYDALAEIQFFCFFGGVVTPEEGIQSQNRVFDLNSSRLVRRDGHKVRYV